MTATASLVGRIVHATYGYNCTRNDFCVIVQETPKTVVLAPLETKWIDGTVKHFQGIPVLGMEKPVPPPADLAGFVGKVKTFRARIHLEDSGKARFRYKDRSYAVWDGEARNWNSD